MFTQLPNLESPPGSILLEQENRLLTLDKIVRSKKWSFEEVSV